MPICQNLQQVHVIIMVKIQEVIMDNMMMSSIS